MYAIIIIIIIICNHKLFHIDRYLNECIGCKYIICDILIPSCCIDSLISAGVQHSISHIAYIL